MSCPDILFDSDEYLMQQSSLKVHNRCTPEMFILIGSSTTKAAQRIVIFQILDYMRFLFFKRSSDDIFSEIKEQIHPQTQQKCTLLGRISANVNSIVHFQTIVQFW